MCVCVVSVVFAAANYHKQNEKIEKKWKIKIECFFAAAPACYDCLPIVVGVIQQSTECDITVYSVQFYMFCSVMFACAKNRVRI